MDKLNDITSAIASSDAGQLLRLIGLDEATKSGWAVVDAASIFHHQMNAPLDFDLSGETRPGNTTLSALKELSAAQTLGIKTFGQLFRHPSPPIEILKLAKDFFKRMAGVHPKDSAEYQVAYACYVLSVTVVRIKHEKRITNLSDASLLKGLDWTLRQAWVETSIRQVLDQARRNFPLLGGH